MFSIIMPLDTNRLKQFANTKRAYDSMPQTKEFLVPTRHPKEILDYLSEHKLDKDVRYLPYTHKLGFNPSKALNLGVKFAEYEQVIITSPEVLPMTDVLTQLEELIGQNVICQVFDEWEDGKLGDVLVSTIFRSDTPAMYFLAMFNKSDIEKINGWDEEFMRGYAYEDNDFGERWVRAQIPYIVRDDIKARHQYHPRSETIRGGATTNFNKYNENRDRGIIRCENGLNMV